jgi:hypothetical protein
MNILKISRKPYLSIILASLVLFVSCNQYDNGINEEVRYNKENRILSDSEVIKIGENHNTSLSELFSENPQSLTDVKTKALELYTEKGLTNLMLDEYFDNVGKMNTLFLVDLIEKNKVSFVDSELLKSKILEIKEIKEIKLLKEHEQNTRKELKGIDLDLYLVLSTVYQYSTEFWTAHFSNDLKAKNSSSKLKMDWREADGISAAIGFFTLVVAFAAISAVGVATGGTGIIPTVTIVASLLRIGASSALASIYAAFL